MGARYNVTNKTRGPRGYREEGKAHPTTVQPGETATLIFDEVGEKRMLQLQEHGDVSLSRLADLSGDPALTPAGELEQPPAPAAPEPTAADLAAETDRQNAAAAEEQALADAESLRQTEAATEDPTETEPEFTDDQIESWKPELLRSYITEKTGEAPAASCNTKTLINKAKAAAAPKASAPAPEEAV